MAVVVGSRQRLVRYCLTARSPAETVGILTCTSIRFFAVGGARAAPTADHSCFQGDDNIFLHLMVGLLLKAGCIAFASCSGTHRHEFVVVLIVLLVFVMFLEVLF